MMLEILTYTKSSSQADQRTRRPTFWENRLEDIVGKGQGCDSISGREDYDNGDPEVKKRWECPIGLINVGIISTRSASKCVILKKKRI